MRHFNFAAPLRHLRAGCTPADHDRDAGRSADKRAPTMVAYRRRGIKVSLNKFYTAR